MTAKVTVTATHVVQSAHPISLQDPFVLGAFDQLGHYATPINVVWIYKTSSHAKLVPLARLQKAISRLLDYYPHLTGRLHINASTGLRSVTRLGTGMHLLEASCNTPLQAPSSDDGYSVFDLPGSGLDLLAPWDLSLEGAQRDPIFTIQRTEFACSAVAVGVRLSHVVCGAGGFLRLYQDLAEIYRAVGLTGDGEAVELVSPPHLSPFMESPLLEVDSSEREKALSDPPPDYSLASSNIAAQTQAEAEHQSHKNSITDQIIGRSVRFSTSEIAILKAKAMAPNDTTQMSAFTVLSAHLWQRIHIARLARSMACSGKDPVLSNPTFGTSVDFSRLLGLSPRYFGNAVVTPITELSSTDLATQPLWKIAKIVHDLIRPISAEDTRKLGRWIAAQPNKSLIRLNFQATQSSFISTGWHVFPLYTGAGLDVVLTFASAVFMPDMFDGMVLFLQPARKNSDMESIISLASSTWEALGKDKEFIKVLGSGKPAPMDSPRAGDVRQ